jgi:hypothetical protein
MIVLKRNAADNGTEQLLVGPPGSPGFLTFDPNSPTFTTLDGTLTLSSNVLSVTNAAVNADWNAGSGLAQILNKPSLATVATSGSYNDLTNKPTIPSISSRSFSYQTRALNTCFQVSSTRDAFVSYAVDIQTSLSLTSGQQGTVYLRTYTNAGCTTGAQELTRFVNGQTGVLTAGLSLSQNVTGTLNGIVPAGAYVQIVPENNTGLPVFTARPGQEVLL